MTTAASAASRPRLGLLLDVDGPIASPITRTIAIDGIADDLVAIANAGNPVVFNTGRSDAFIRDVVLTVLLDRGLDPAAPVHAVCEKGASWFSLESVAGRGVAGPVHVDDDLCVPAELGSRTRELAETGFADTMFWDDTKRTMLSVEQRVDVDPADYRRAQSRFDVAAQALVDDAGLAADFRLDPSIISTDIEHRAVGKDLGAARAVELIAARGPLPARWYTAGDSRGDYAMATWLHEQGHEVEHLDVRPLDGVPETPYPVLRAHDDDVIHDHSTAIFLERWRREAV